MPDPNWLYATVAQCSAAVVAIVGGFITATMLQRSGERESLSARVDELRGLATVLRDQRVHETDKRDERAFQFWVQDQIGDILDLSPWPTAEQARRDLDGTHITETVFAQQWAQLEAEIQAERNRVEADVAQFGDEDFDDLVEAGKIDTTARDVWLARRIHWQRLRAATQAKAASTGWGTQLGWPPGIDPVSILSPKSEAQYSRELAVQQEQERELAAYDTVVADLERRAALADAERELLEARLRRIRRPRHVTAGFVVLIGLTVGGVLVPIWFLPQDPTDYSPASKIIVLTAFLLGLLSLSGLHGRVTPRNPRCPSRCRQSARARGR
jgi:hypothetical protein